MNETLKNGPGRRILRVFWVWLLIFAVIVLMVRVADLTTKASNRFFPEVVLSLVAATVSLGLWLFIRWVCNRRNLGRVLVSAAILGTLVALFYLEENWRGKRAWDQCKAELEAKGAVLDWNKFIPPPVPDDQNFFTASSNMLLRFKKAQTDTESDLASKSQWLSIVYSTNSFPVFDSDKANPLVVAKLTAAPSAVAPPVTEGMHPLVVRLGSADARQQVQDLIRTTIGRGISGAAGFQFSERQLSNLAPAQIILQADATPSVADLQSLIPENLVTNVGHLRIETDADKKSFQVLLTGVHATWAVDYLKWSDQFGPALDEVREALKRPYALLPGDYALPYAIPVPNFVTMRGVAQLLAQRAQCHMLLGQPDEAVHEIMLMHDLCRILVKPPTGKPETLVEAMINVAIGGLYANTIADGFRLGAWHEPQLTVLQEQLKAINLLPPAATAFQSLPAAECRNLEILPLTKWLAFDNSRMGWKSKARWWLIPRGWVYQNMTLVAKIGYEVGQVIDATNNLVLPRRSENLAREMNEDFFRGNARPYNFLAAMIIPNFTKAWQTAAYNQTMINEAQIVCALERFRLAHGNYPEALDALVPQFIETLPHDLIGGGPLHYRRTNDQPSQSSGPASGKFLLYSVGWNEADDGGEASPPVKVGPIDYTKGDWVWKN